ncbi:hypothetical protein FALCPG4_003730 [Fusarium falciforme]
MGWATISSSSLVSQDMPGQTPLWVNQYNEGNVYEYLFEDGDGLRSPVHTRCPCLCSRTLGQDSVLALDGLLVRPGRFPSPLHRTLVPCVNTRFCIRANIFYLYGTLRHGLSQEDGQSLQEARALAMAASLSTLANLVSTTFKLASVLVQPCTR